MAALFLAAILACLAPGAFAQEPATVLRDNTTGFLRVAPVPPSRADLPERMTSRRADDRTTYMKIREFFMPETGVDPLSQEYEKLYGEPDPLPGNRQLDPWRPFEDVKKWNEAFDRAAAGLQTEVARDGNKVAVRVDLPTSEGKKLEVYVNEDRILLSLSFPAPARAYRIPRRDDFVIALPDRADAKTASVSRQGDKIQILFRER